MYFRAKYHHICRMLLKQDVEIRCDKMAGAIVNNDNKTLFAKESYLSS